MGICCGWPSGGRRDSRPTNRRADRRKTSLQWALSGSSDPIVLNPLPNITVHVVTPERIEFERTDWRCLLAIPPTAAVGTIGVAPSLFGKFALSARPTPTLHRNAWEAAMERELGPAKDARTPFLAPISADLAHKGVILNKARNGWQKQPVSVSTLNYLQFLFWSRLMQMLPRLMIACLLSVGPGAQAQQLQPGLYEISVRVALPNLGDAIPATITQECFEAERLAGAAVFAVRSANNPLQTCPRSEIVRNGDTTTFDIACPGPNKAHASAVFTEGSNRFHGLFTMNMGGKNMTMTEMQDGRLIGACPNRTPF